MWEVLLITQQSKPVVNNIMAHTTIPELSQYFYTTLFSLTTVILFKEINKGFLRIWPSLTEGFINKHI